MEGGVKMSKEITKQANKDFNEDIILERMLQV